MKFIDLEIQQSRIKSSVDKRIQSVLSHGQYIMGPEVREVEESLGAYAGTKYAVGCASGTDALLMALMAYGVRPGDAVFTTPFTFIATAEVIRLLGATPIFVDVDQVTYNLDPGKLGPAVEAVRASDRSLHPLPATGFQNGLTPRGVIAVDLFGLPADYDRINSIAREHGLFVIEDAAQSFGAEYNGRKCCSLADIGCTSFFPAKPLGCYGDGGMCFTDDKDLAEKMRSIRVHGKGVDKYDNARIGINGRLDTLQAAVLLAKFEIFPEEISLRRQAADRYFRLIAASGHALGLPQVPSGLSSAWAQYSILCLDQNHRAAMQQKLKERDVPTAIYYPKALHLQEAFAELGHQKGDFPVSEELSERVFSIPMHPYLSKSDQEMIAEVLRTL